MEVMKKTKNKKLIPFLVLLIIFSLPVSAQDVNLDGSHNVVDVVMAVQFIIGDLELDLEQQNEADIDNDGVIDIIDVVSLVDIVLGTDEEEDVSWCEDSDGGVVPNIRGNITGFNISSSFNTADYCLSSINEMALMEYSCASPDSNLYDWTVYSSSIVYCEEGRVCINGECVQEIDYGCIDFDEEILNMTRYESYYFASNTSWPDGSGGCIDHCGNHTTTSDVLYECYCTANGGSTSDQYDCPNGCEDGACVQEVELNNIVNSFLNINQVEGSLIYDFNISYNPDWILEEDEATMTGYDCFGDVRWWAEDLEGNQVHLGSVGNGNNEMYGTPYNVYHNSIGDYYSLDTPGWVYSLGKQRCEYFDVRLVSTLEEIESMRESEDLDLEYPSLIDGSFNKLKKFRLSFGATYTHSSNEDLNNEMAFIDLFFEIDDDGVWECTPNEIDGIVNQGFCPSQDIINQIFGP